MSVATVSYVMNDRMDRRIPTATRQRVLAAARQLDYSPNRAARSLRRRRTDQVCLVIESIGVPSNDQLARTLRAGADEAGYGLITIVVESQQRAERAVRLFQQGIADGVAVGPTIRPHFAQPALAQLARSGLALVVMSNRLQPEGFDVIRSLEASACGDALDQLFAAGRRRVAFLGHWHELQPGFLTTSGPSERYASYLAALRRHGVEWDGRLVAPGADDRVEAYRAVEALLARRSRPDAVFAASARAAVSAIWAARDAGLTLPRDLAVVGCGNLPDALITRPTLSVVGPDPENYAAVPRLLFERLRAEGPMPGREVSVPWSFLRRDSS